MPKTIAEWRKERRMTVAELARYAGVSDASIYMIESGRVKAPQSRTVDKVSEALRVEPNEVIEFLPRIERVRFKPMRPEAPSAQELVYTRVSKMPYQIKPLRFWLRERGMTRAEFTALTGLNHVTIQRAVDGMARPTEKTANRILEALKLEVEQVQEFVFSLLFHPCSPVGARYPGGRYSIRTDFLYRLPVDDLYTIVRIDRHDIDAVLQNSNTDWNGSKRLINKESVLMFFPNADLVRMEYPEGAPKRITNPAPRHIREAHDREAILERVKQYEEWKGSVFDTSGVKKFDASEYPDEDESFFEEEE